MVGKQLGFSDYEKTNAKKQTKLENFLAEIEAVVPWQALIVIIELLNANCPGQPNAAITWPH